jgi:hypothetical protein
MAGLPYKSKKEQAAAVFNYEYPRDESLSHKS